MLQLSASPSMPSKVAYTVHLYYMRQLGVRVIYLLYS